MLRREGLCWFSSNKASVTAALSSGSCAHVLRLAGYSSPVRVIPRNPFIPKMQLTACSPDLSLAQPHPEWCPPLQEFSPATNSRLAEPWDSGSYPFETCTRSGVSFIRTYLFLCKSSLKWKHLEIRHLLPVLAEATTTRSKVHNISTDFRFISLISHPCIKSMYMAMNI